MLQPGGRTRELGARGAASRRADHATFAAAIADRPFLARLHVPETLLTRWSESLHCEALARARAERTCCLVCIHPESRLGQVVRLANAEIVVGRDSGCGLELPDDSVSRRHALLKPTADAFAVTDLGSTNGTYVNEQRVDTRELTTGDRVRFGNQIFKFLSADRFEAEYFEATYRMMTTDGLTQVHNRRYLLETAERELRRTKRTGSPLSVLMIDVDRFKSINDELGHLAGDEVLIELARRLRSTLRGDDLLARWGGEEFCLLLPETGAQEALIIAERIRALVACQKFQTEHASRAVTISVGVACAETGDDVALGDLLRRADECLYEAKRAGRNRAHS
jgi:diguanylate cyclase (GGDEF)-like protein